MLVDGPAKITIPPLVAPPASVKVPVPPTLTLSICTVPRMSVPLSATTLVLPSPRRMPPSST
ncbi:hypothetical protein D3C72_1499520 [compost metagenome]